MSDESEWSAPDQRPAQGGGAEQPGAERPGHGQAQNEWGPPMPPPPLLAPPPPPPGWGGYQPHVAKPGVIPLRPLGLGEILDGAFSTIRAYPKLTLGVSAIVVAISQIIIVAVMVTFALTLTAFQADVSTPGIVLTSGLGIALVTVGITVLSDVFLSGFLTVVVGRAVIGQPVSFREVWAQLRRKLLPLLGLTLLYGLIVTVAALFLIIPGVWLGGLFSLATVALVLEPVSVGRALGRSRALVRGSWWRVFLILLLCEIIASIIAGMIDGPFILLDGVLNGASVPEFVRLLVSAVGSVIGAAAGGAITYPFFSAVQALLYVDQRMRREGMDIELARAAGVPAAQGYPGPPAAGWVTGP